MKNILVLFVSPVHKDKTTQGIQTSKYKWLYKDDLEKVVETTQTNQSAVIYLGDKIGKIDRIFAFVSEKVEVEKLKIIQGQSHYDYFKKIVRPYVNREEDIIMCRYGAENDTHEANKEVEESMDAISRMAMLIMQEKDALHDDEITLHADMTGGLRNASMMMLGIMRFLEYSGLKIGKVMYSNWEGGRAANWVEEANQVYGFFDLVAGAKEFNNFGSVKEISKYYKDNDLEIGLTLKELLKAMEKFSEEIKLCHTGELVAATDNLARSIKTFESDEDNNNKNIKIFKAMLSAVKAKYRKIIETSKEDKLSLIEWCVENDYIQQALTLYTELMPKMFFDKNIISIVYTEYKKMHEEYEKDKKKNNSPNLEFEFYIIGKASGNSLQENIAFNKNNIQVTSDYFADIVRFIFSLDRNGYGELKKRMSMAPKSVIPDAWDKICPQLIEVAEYIDENEKDIDSNKNVVLKKIAEQNKKIINCPKTIMCKTVSNKETFSPKALLNFFGVKAEDFALLKANTRSDAIVAMCRNKVLESVLEEDQIRKLMECYFAIKAERNGVNHARLNGDVMSLRKIKKMLKEAIGQFKKCCKEVEIMTEKKIKTWKEMPRNNSEELARADAYFDNELMPLAANRFIQTQHTPKKYCGMILTLGTSWQPLALSILALQPDEILFLCTEDTKELINTLVAFAKIKEDKYNVAIVNRSDVKTIYTAMAENCKNWQAKGNVCIDITGGTKAMASGAAMFGAVLGADIYYVESKYLPLYRRPEPGSEILKQLENPQEFMKKIGG